MDYITIINTTINILYDCSSVFLVCWFSSTRSWPSPPCRRNALHRSPRTWWVRSRPRCHPTWMEIMYRTGNHGFSTSVYFRVYCIRLYTVSCVLARHRFFAKAVLHIWWVWDIWRWYVLEESVEDKQIIIKLTTPINYLHLFAINPNSPCELNQLSWPWGTTLTATSEMNVR